MAKLVAIQQPQTTFHKDEGGKTNNLAFRVLLQGEIDVSLGGIKGEVPLEVVAVFEDGTEVPKQDEIISVTGCTEKPNGTPCVCLVSRLGGVTYRLKQVSKRLDDRPVCVRVSLKGCPEVEPITSEGTMVFSKRKNRSQREKQQAQEKMEMERKEAEAASLLVHNIGGTERPTKLVKFEVPSGASTLYDETDECSDAASESLVKRIADLEKLVQDQQKQIDDLKIFLPLGPPQGGRRSTSQAAWGIRPDAVASLGTYCFLNPPMLRRDTSTDSLPDLPVLPFSAAFS